MSESTSNGTPAPANKEFFEDFATFREATKADATWEDLYVDVWGKWIHLKSPTMADRNKYDAIRVKIKKGGGHELNGDNMSARLVAMCWVNKNGSKICRVESQIQELGQRHPRAVSQIVVACNRICGYDVEEVEARLKNAESAQPADSSDILPEPSDELISSNS